MNPSQAGLIIRDPAYLKVKQDLIAATGMAYYETRDDAMIRVVHQRLAELKLPAMADYLHLLAGVGRQNELQTVASQLAIGETSFFRNQAHFEAMRTLIFPDLLRRYASSKRLRIWSAGCSNGAETYSISILLRREFGLLIRDWDVRIVGTDISATSLAQAQEGSYSEWTLRSMPERLRNACFEKQGSTWTIKPEYRQGVVFENHNLMDERFRAVGAEFHLIVCQNVIIYFEPHRAHRLIEKFHESLASSGWLILGPGEADLSAFRTLFLVNCGGPALYRKRAGDSALFFEDAKQSQVQDIPGPVPALETIVETAKPDMHNIEHIRRLADSGEWKKAVDCCEYALLRDSKNPYLHFYFAMVVHHLGQRKHAKTLLQTAIQLDPRFVLAHYHLGLVLKEDGEFSDARRHLQIVLELLARVPEDHVYPEGDGIAAADLKDLTILHLEVLGN